MYLGMRDKSFFDGMSQIEIEEILAELEQKTNAEAIAYAQMYFPDYVHDGELLKFTLITDLGL